MGRRIALRKTGWARALLALALIGMFVRAATPAGYMFAADKQGRFLTVTLCSAHGATETVIDVKTGALVDQKSKPGDGKQQAMDSPCAFALSSALGAPQDAGLAPAPFAIAMRAPSGVVANLRPGLGLVAPPPPARAPPSLIV